MEYPKLSKAEKKVERRKAKIRRQIEIYHELKALSSLEPGQCLVLNLNNKRKKNTLSKKPTFPRTFRVKSKVDRAVRAASHIERQLDPLRDPFKYQLKDSNN